MDRAAKGKGLGALAILAFKGKPKAPKPISSISDEPDEDDAGGMPDDDMDDTGGDEHDAAFTSFADAAGIPEESRARAGAALKQYVKACLREYGSNEEG